MATTRPDRAASDPAATAAALAEAEFVRVLARAGGDELAAAGLLAAALRERGTPFQVRVRAWPPAAATEGDADTAVVGLGVPAAELTPAPPGGDRPASVVAHAVARELDATPAPTLALAGAVAAGVEPGSPETGTERLVEAARRRAGVERRPGLALPTDDLATGLAATTLVRAPWSGDRERATELLARLGTEPTATLDDEAARRLASLVAVEVTTAPDATPTAAAAVDRLLGPLATPEGPFATVGGHADVLTGIAREEPGTGVALALGGRDGYDPVPAATAAWREHGRAVHRLLGEATTARHPGVSVVRVGATSFGRLRTAARLHLAFRAAEPVALVVGDDRAAAVAAEPCGLATTLSAAATEATGDERRAIARIDEPDAVVERVREGIR